MGTGRPGSPAEYCYYHRRRRDSQSGAGILLEGSWAGYFAGAKKAVGYDDQSIQGPEPKGSGPLFMSARM